MRIEDWQGQEYGPGDTVLYAAMSGRSVTMVKAEVLDIWRVRRGENYDWERIPDTAEPDGSDELRVQLKPLGSSRWKQHHGKDYYIDKRTGKRIDPWKGNGKHIASGGHEACKKTGAKLDGNNCADDGCAADARWNPRGLRGHHTYEMKRYVSTVFKDYVEQVHEETKKVTLTVTENITKLAGCLPG